MKNILRINPKYYTLVSILTLLTATVIFWHPLIFLNKTLFFDLTTRYFFPAMTFFKGAILSLQNPLWNPFIYSGLPFLANPQAGVFYPFNYFFVFFDFPVALNIYIVLHTFLAGIFMYFLAKHLGISNIGAVVSGFIFMFNGFFVYHMEYVSNIASYIWIPLILLFFDKYFKERDFQYLLFTAVLLTLQFLGGMPAFSYYTVIVLTAYFLFINPSLSGPVHLIKVNTMNFMALGLMFILFAMVQILPAIELVLNSVRNTGLDFQSAAAYSLGFQDFISFLFLPFWNSFKPFWSGDVHVIGFYFGITGILITGAYLLRGFYGKKLFFIVIFSVFSLFSLGKNIPLVYDLFYSYFPGFKYFRFPAQLLYIAGFAFAVIAGFSMENIKRTYVKAGFAALIFLELFIFGYKANPLIDTGYFAKDTPNISFFKNDRQLYRFMMDPALRKEAPLYGKDDLSFRLNYKNMLYPNIGMAYRFFDVDGFETLRLKDYEDIINRIDNPSSKLLDMLNMKYILTRNKLSAKKYGPANLEGDPKIYLNSEFLPRFYFVDKAKYLSKEKTLEYISGNEFDPKNEVILAEEATKPEVPIEFSKKQKKAFCYIEKYRLNEIELLAAAVKPLWLVTSEVFYPGWNVTIDGKKAELLKANYAFRAVYIPKGSHRIKFNYFPRSFKIGAGISFLSLFLALLLEMILGYRDWRRRPSAKEA